MALSETTLADALIRNTANLTTPEDAVEAWVDAWASYFEESSSAGPYNKAATPVLSEAMAAALKGFSEPSDSPPGPAPQKIEDAVIAWWAALSANASTAFTGALSASAPPALPLISEGLILSYPAGLLLPTLAAGMRAVAGILHVNNGFGFIVYPNPAAPPPTISVPLI